MRHDRGADESVPARNRGMSPEQWDRVVAFGRRKLQRILPSTCNDRDDVLQDALVALLTAMDASHDKTSVFGFLKKALSVHSLLLWRRERRKQSVAGELDRAPGPESGPTEAEVRSILGELPKHLHIWIPVMLSTEPLAEVAARHGVSVTTIRWRMFQIACWLTGRPSRKKT